MLSKSEENYLKEIYALSESSKEVVNTSLLANKLATKSPSVTEMLKKLAKKNLLKYEKYKGVKLNTQGKSIALGIIRKHRLWETFLVDKLNFNWDEVHVIAEQLEHIQSDQLTDRLDEFLGFPTMDPHGDPIPNKKGQVIKINKTPLFNMGISEEGVFIGVKSSSDSFLKYLSKNNISIGCKIKIISIEDFDNSLKIEINNLRFNISKDVAQNLYMEVK